MRHRLLAVMAIGASLAFAPLVAATAAVAAPAPATTAATAPTTVTADECFDNGGYFGGYNSDAKAFCVDGIYNGIPFDVDPQQGWCPDGQHMTFVYLEGIECTVDLPNT
ncbi:hypothetical protein POF50_010830 [Streptomyces sp. SL13]|uniref:Secreted protein n=1 Tax=Streptantibioticus silvisoli TaxID=2705255 RepID=A0AA90K8A7_9ACTN|nr:hypothetical protein [Streptantibioticus silvisoli]MDI5969823.1 hypothetical protein [Streptantibioticus silvisoli]